MTAETTPMTREQIHARRNEIAPYPERGTRVTGESLARYLAVLAQLGWSRNVTPFIRDDQEIPYQQVAANFAAAHALLALHEVDPEKAALTAAQIADAWNDGAGIGEWLFEHLTRLGADPREVARLDEARLALENARRGIATEGPCCTGCGPGCACGSPHEDPAQASEANETEAGR